MDQNEIKEEVLSPVLPEEGEKKQAFGRLIGFLEEKREGSLPLVLSFLLPFVIFGLCLAFLGVYPFGDQQVINYDGWHQYYPFLLQLWDHFHEGTSLLYDWTMGMGTNFLSMLSYYGSSPLNLLLFLVPVREFRVLFTFFVVLRIALAGFFCGLFLRKVFKKGSWAIPFFSLGYALCGYMMGYFWNNMWLDAVALYPLLCLVTVKLFREGKSAPYIAVLALSLFSNYYIGYMCCVFTVLVFIILCVLDRVRFSDFWRKGLRFALASLWGASVSAVLLLPAFFGLLNTASTSGESAGLYVSFYESVRDLIAPLVSFHVPAVMDGLPNIGTAAILSLFAFAFLWAKKVSLREKLCAFFLILFLLFSMNFSVLNYFWHGFHFTNMIPYRFAFLFVFAVVVMAWRYYLIGMKDFDYIDAIGMVIFAALTAFCAFGYYPNWAILATVAVFALGIVITVLYSAGMLSRRVLTAALCLILTVEMTFSAVLGTRAVGTSSYSEYFDLQKGEEVRQMVRIAEEREGDKADFYRMESTEWRSLNDSCFYEYNGISQFASSANRNVSYFLRALGMPADPGSNRFVYVHGTRMADVVLGLKYLIAKNGHLSGEGLTCISPAKNDVTTALYECDYFSGLGFMTDQDGADFEFDMAQTPYERQNELFRAMTGLEGDLFTTIPATQGEHLNLTAEETGEGYFAFTAPALSEDTAPDRVLRLTYTLPKNSTVYIYADVPMARYVQTNNAWHCIEDYPNFFSAGAFTEGETFTLRAVIDEESREEFSDYALFYVCVMDEALWQEGLARLQDETMNIEEMGDTFVKGTVTAKKDGYLYTSIPMELEGNWEAKLDGKSVPVEPFAGAFVGLSVPEGEHEVEFHYSPAGFAKGRWITAVSLVLLILLFVWEKKEHKLFPEKSMPCSPERKEEGQGEEGGKTCDSAETDESDSQSS